MEFRRFLIFWIALVAITIILVFLCLMGFGFVILQSALTIIVVISILAIGLVISTKLGDRAKKASPEEIRREDDVLLEAVAFSQSILFVLLSLMQSEDRLREVLLYGTAMTTILFYALRAWAKIRDSPKYRYYSMIAFAFLFGNTVTSILKLYFNIPDEFMVNMGMVYLGIVMSLMGIADKVFKKRYGYKGRSLFSF